MKQILPIVLISICLACNSCADRVTENMKELSQIADQINEECPKMLDSETRFDGIDVKEPNTLVYRYTLVNLVTQNIDTSEFYRAMWPGLISNIKVSPEMKKLRENNTSIEYFYGDKSGKPVYTFKIEPEDYK